MSLNARPEKAIDSYDQSIKNFDHFLQYSPDSIDGLNNKAIGLRKLGDLQNKLLHHNEALISLNNAIAIDDQILQKEPNHKHAKKNRQAAVRALDDAQRSLAN